MIEVQHLTKRYGKLVAVDDVSFKIRNGRIYGLLGPNGAGKSTTMNMITGCLSPTEGTVLVNGYDICDNPKEAKQQIGYLPEIPPLFGDMTPWEYLAFVAEAKGVGTDLALRQINEVMVLTDIAGVRDKLIRTLSKGYRQRVGIAQALLGNPDIIILDEPTVGLDPKQITDIRALIRRLGENKTVIISSHILAEISEMCDHVIILDHGRVVADDEIENIRTNTVTGHELYLTARGDEAGILAAVRGVPGVRSVDVTTPAGAEKGTVSLTIKVGTDVKKDLRDDIFFAMAEKRYIVTSLEQKQSLEAAFLTLTADMSAADMSAADISAADDTATDESTAEPKQPTRKKNGEEGDA